jgi:hypothetical protein
MLHLCLWKLFFVMLKEDHDYEGREVPEISQDDNLWRDLCPCCMFVDQYH